MITVVHVAGCYSENIQVERIRYFFKKTGFLMIPPKKKVKTIYIFNSQVSKLGNLKWKFKELMTNFTLTGKN